VFLGRGPLFGIALEGALKLMEMSQIMTQAFHPLEYRHGPISLVDGKTAAVMLYSSDQRKAETKLVRELKEKGAVVIGLGGPRRCGTRGGCRSFARGSRRPSGAAGPRRARRSGSADRHGISPPPDEGRDSWHDAIEENRQTALRKLFGARNLPVPRGITSVCSAHPLVIEAALRRAAAGDRVVLIEATCNQVNQEGGYTGMKPSHFRRFIEGIAANIGFPVERIIFGGDHLGPNPWRKLPAEDAMVCAEAMVAAYVEAGFEKIHLDTSMGCAGEPLALADELTAARAARLAKTAEDAALRSRQRPPVYVIGTEVPPPGGATHQLEEIEITQADAALKTLDVHRAAFAKAGVAPAMERVIGIVVQPGVEFGNANVGLYKPDRAQGLIAALDQMPGLLFEAHSTDYQPAEALSALVDGGFAILKVGPGLTFALREALYGLDAIAAVTDGQVGKNGLAATMETLMAEQPVKLGRPLQRWRGRRALAKAFQLQRPDPLLLAGCKGNRRSRRHVRTAPRRHSRNPHQSASKPSLCRRRRKAGRPSAARTVSGCDRCGIGPLFSSHRGPITERRLLAAAYPNIRSFSRRKLWRQ
jgi:D-tagatose-bisphosphate aldolase class II non-catalytic subunit